MPAFAEPRYLYRLSFESFDREIALAEAAEWLDRPVDTDFHFADTLHDLTPCAYLAHAYELLARAPRFDDLVDRVRALRLPFDGYAIDSAKTVEAVLEPPVKKLGSMGVARALADALEGMPNLEQPRDSLWALRLPQEWIFARQVSRYAQHWTAHQHKPHSYSSSVKPRLARALVNLAAPARLAHRSFLDPCCGAGTTLIEAAHRGLAAFGVDIGYKIAQAARGNLAHFGFPVEVVHADAADWPQLLVKRAAAGNPAPLPDRFDAAVIDFPYGHFSPAEAGLYDRLLAHLRPRLNRVVVVTAQPATDLLTRHGYKVLRTATARKSRLVRHITLATTQPDA